MSGNASDVVTDVVTAAGTDDDGTPVSDDDDAVVTVTDVEPAISLTKTATPLSLPEPGGDFTFDVVVSNGSVEPVELLSLDDDVYGDVTLVAGAISATDCAVPQTIAGGWQLRLLVHGRLQRQRRRHADRRRVGGRAG